MARDRRSTRSRSQQSAHVILDSKRWSQQRWRDIKDIPSSVVSNLYDTGRRGYCPLSRYGISAGEMGEACLSDSFSAASRAAMKGDLKNAAAFLSQAAAQAAHAHVSESIKKG